MRNGLANQPLAIENMRPHRTSSHLPAPFTQRMKHSLTRWPVVGVWASITLLSTAQGYFAQVASGTPEPLVRSFYYAATVYLTWIVFTPVVIMAARVFPPRRDRLVKTGLVHLLVAVAVASVHSSIHLILFWSVYPDIYGILSDQRIFLQKLIGGIHVDVIIYFIALYAIMTFNLLRRHAQKDAETSALRAMLAEAEAAGARGLAVLPGNIVHVLMSPAA